MVYASDDPLAVAAESLSLVLIVASFLVLTFLTYRTSGRRRFLRRFHLEMFLFAVVLVAAEVPRTLYSLGLLDIGWLSTVGLGIHSVSMVVLAGFVALRINGYFRWGEVLGQNFETVVQGAVDAGILRSLGEGPMKSLNFYVGSKLAADDPEGYARSLEKIFGTGAKVLIEAITKSVCNATGLDFQSGQSLPSVIQAGRQKFLASGTPVKS